MVQISHWDLALKWSFNMSAGFYTHPAFTDVLFYLHKAFKVPAKDVWKLKVTWYHKRGYELANEKLQVNTQKLSEFRRIR